MRTFLADLGWTLFQSLFVIPIVLLPYHWWGIYGLIGAIVFCISSIQHRIAQLINHTNLRGDL